MDKFDLKSAVEIQNELAERVIVSGAPEVVKFVAGADCSYNNMREEIGAVVVICEVPSLEIIDTSQCVEKINMPYIPGFLNFREGPVIIRAVKKLGSMPDLTLIDGNGIAHPRRMGLASYVGVKLDIASVGCAKNPFYPFEVPGPQRGDYTIFKNKNNEKVGYSVRTKKGVKPIFVSPGHKIDFEAAKSFVLKYSKFRIPEPLRQAHRLARNVLIETANG
jgi:deoxyribonuclease V